MPQTQIPSQQIQDGGIQRADLCVAGAAGTNVIAKAIQGTGIQLNATGAEAGTGDVTVGLAAIATQSILGNVSIGAAVPVGITAWANPPWLTAVAWGKITGTPTTLAGYGITDPVNPAFTGDVTKAAGGTVTALANIPTATPAAGSINMAGITSPLAVAGGAQLYVDSTSKNFCSKDPSGNISHAIRTRAAVAKNYITGINDDGTTTVAVPQWTDITGTPTTLAGYGIASPLPIAQGGTGNTSGAEPPLGNPSSSGMVLSSTNLGVRSWITLGGGGNVIVSGSPSSGQLAVWTDATHIQGVADTTKQWDGGATGLTAATGRSSLGLGSAALMTGPAGAIVGTTDTQTLTNKREVPRTTLLANTVTSVTPNADTDDVIFVDNISASAISIVNPTGTPTEGQQLVIRIKGNTASTPAKVLSWGTAYGGAPLPLALPNAASGSTGCMHLTFRWNVNLSKWLLIACTTDVGYSSLQAAPTSPTGITGATGKMMGMGATAKITPQVTGKVMVLFFGTLLLQTAGTSATFQMYYGTGISPANAAAITGTAFGNFAAINALSSYGQGILVGFVQLTIGQTYWFDVAGSGNNATSVATYSTPACSIFELP